MNLFTYKNVVPAQFFAALTAFSMLLSALPVHFFVAEATPPVPYSYDPSVTICHANAGTNLYTKNTVNASSIIGPSGHDSHDTKGLNDMGDIIPSFEYNPGTGTTTYPGKNLTVGQAILDKNCEVSVPATSGVLTVTKVIEGITDATAEDFSFQINGGTAVAFEADGSNDVELTLTDGPFTVTEVDANTGYTTGYAGCTDVALTESGAACTVTNTFESPSADTGTLEITKYACPADTTVIRSENGVGGTIPDGCSLQEGVTFGYVHGDQTDVNGPYPELEAPITEAGATNGSGLLSVELEATGRYLIVETDGAGNQLPAADVMGLYCIGDGDTSDTNDNQELTFITEGETTSCVAYNVAPPIVDVCTNIDEVQETLPEGYEFTSEGICEPIPEPVCKIGENLLMNGSFEEPAISGSWSLTTITNWVITKVADATGVDGELWKGLFGGASDGLQNVELDSTEPTVLSQSVTTIPGATYELRFDFSPRPNTSASNNDVDARVDGSMIMNASGDGSTISANTWSTHSQTFVASTSATEISFADNGVADKLGSLIDNAVLCLVSEPEPEPIKCTLDIVSDTTDYVVEKDDTAKALSFIHNAWTAVINGATWIWGDDPVVNPSVEETQTFEKKFGWEGIVTNATLYVASDNSHAATLNGDVAGVSTDEQNFRITDQDEYDVTSFIDQGNNDLSIAVKNWAGSANPQTNPAGLLYKLHIEGTVTDDADCSVPYEEPEPVDECVISGYKYDEEGNPLQNWVIGLAKSFTFSIGNQTQVSTPWLTGYDVTDANGYYCIEEKKHIYDTFDWSDTGMGNSEDAHFFGLYGSLPQFGMEYYAFEVLKDGWEGLWIDVDETGTTTPSSNAFFDVYTEIDLDEDTQVDFYNTEDNGGGGNPVLTSEVTMCKVDESRQLLAGWNLMLLGDKVDTVQVPATTNAGVDTVNLLNGAPYVAVANGTWDNNRNPLNIVDAEYSTEDNWLTQMDGFIGYGVSILELAINAVDGDWGAYNSAHRYAQSFIPTIDGSASISILDTNYSDNTGSLDVDVYEGYSGVTDSNGCVTFSDVPYGSYTIDEIMHDDWTNVSGLGSVVVDAAEETFTVVNADPLAESSEDTYTVQGYVWHDSNENDIWEGQEEGEDQQLVVPENSLAGWEVRITNGSTTYSTTTDENGYYYFSVPAGTWTVSEMVESGWGLTYPNEGTHTVTVPEAFAQIESSDFFAALVSYLIPTAHAQISQPVYGDYNFGNNELSVRTSSGGGGRRSSSSSDDDTDGPVPQVLGEQVSIVPAGAPDAGAGGTAPFSGTFSTLIPATLVGRLNRKNA